LEQELEAIVVGLEPVLKSRFLLFALLGSWLQPAALLRL
jgi:hypothetical protein